MNILLTGASGFIGSHVAHCLLQDGHRIFAPLRPGALERMEGLISHAYFQPLSGQFYDPHLLEKIREPINLVIHLAAIRGAGRATEDRYQMVNVLGTKQLLQWARERQIKRFLYVSTVGVLGTIPATVPATADLSPDPDGPYHRSKYQAEQLVTAWQDQHFRTLILRPTITYGPGDDGFINKMVELIQRHKMVIPRKEVLIHLLDVQAFAHLIGEVVAGDLFDNRIYHVGDEQAIALAHLVRLIQKEKGGKFWILPHGLFTAAKQFCRLAGLDSLKISLQLISESWYYDIRSTLKRLGYVPAATEEQLKGYLSNNVY